MVVAIDGPAGSGKGTVAKIISQKCNLTYIDTGATYRCVALASINSNMDPLDKKKLISLTKSLNIDFNRFGKTFLNKEDVSDRIREKDVTKIVSQISSIVEIREILVELQRKIAGDKDVIIEGRDTTTIVFPQADYKIYLDASLEERAKRRYLQYKENKINMTYEEIIENIKKRDYNDMHKEVGSLIRTTDQIYIDTTNLTIDEVVNSIIKIIEGE